MNQRPKRFARVPVVLLALAWIYVGALGAASTNVGVHWDESLLIDSVRNSVVTGVPLPHWYNYPSLSYSVGLLTALPSTVAGRGSSPEAVADELGGTAFKLRLRAVFFLLSMLSGVAVFLLIRGWTASEWAALFGALTLLGSWELQYHARWIAPDGLVLLFASFSLWSQHRLMDPGESGRRRRWLVIASVFAGLCLATKYPGGILLIPLWIAVALAPRVGKGGVAGVLAQQGLCLVIAAATFVLVTPGCVFEREAFVRDVLHEVHHYAEGHGGYSVTPGWNHFSKMATYLALVFLSKYPVIAAIEMALALAGAAWLIRSRSRAALWLLSLPLLYILYMSAQQVMIVRNELLLMPSFAALAALGLRALLGPPAGRPARRRAAIALAVVIVAVNLTVATRTSWSIVSPRPLSSRGPVLRRRVESAPATRFKLSPTCESLMGVDPAHRPANVVTTMDSADRVIFISDEVVNWETLPSNRRGLYRTVWSAMDEVNWDYYPSWAGSPRILEVDRALIMGSGR